MKKYFIIIIISALFGETAAQKMSWDIYGGYTGMQVKWETFEKFRTSYNEVNQATQKKELTGFGMAHGYTIGAHQRFGPMLLGLQFDKMFSTATSELNLEEERKFRFKTWLFSTEVGLATHGDNFYIGPVTGLAFGMNKLSCAYIYRDGTESYGTERILNGVYDGIVIKGTYGIKGGVDFSKNWGIFFSGMYLTKWQLVNTSLDDLSTAKSLSLNTSAGGLPTDYKRFLASGSNYDYGDAYVKNDFSGIRFSMGIRLTFGD